MDETKFLTQWYAENHDRGVEVLGLAYERKMILIMPADGSGR